MSGDRALLSTWREPGSQAGALLVNASGDVVCSTAEGLVTCPASGPGPYRVIVQGQAAEDATAHVAVRRLNNPAGCSLVPSIATGIPELRGSLPNSDDVSCFTMAAAVGDQLDVSVIHPDLENAVHRARLFDPTGDLVCSPEAWSSSPQCTVTEGGQHMLVVSSGSVQGNFVLSGTCLNPACGLDTFTAVGVTPKRVGAATPTTLSVQGKALSLQNKVEFVRGDVVIEARPLTVSTDARSLQVEVPFGGAAVGLWDLRVTSTTDGQQTVPGALTLEGVIPPRIDTKLITIGRFVAGRSQTISVIASNSGNVDALGIPVLIDGLPAGSTVVPQFDLYGAATAGAAVEKRAWSQERMTYTRGSVMGIPLQISRIPGGGKVQYDFTVTVSTAADYALTVSASNCFFSPSATAAAPAGLRSSGSNDWAWGGGGCGDALVDLVSGFVPGGPCLGVAKDSMIEISRNVANDAPPFAASSGSDMFWSALGGVSCVASVIPGGQILSGVLDAISNAKNIVTAGTECFGTDDQSAMRSVASMDPNELVGPSGGGTSRAIGKKDVHTFAVFFENAKTATAPAQEVHVVQHLNPAHYDLSTLSFGAVQFGTHRYEAPSATNTLDTYVELSSGLRVHITASVNVTTGAVEWRLRSIDPATGSLPEDPMVGFLPPNVDGSQGQGVVFVDVSLKPLNSGVVTSSTADIYFDLNPGITTNTWSNLIDTDVPTTSLGALTASTGTPLIPVSWNATDSTSGIASVEIYVSVDSGPYTLWRSVSDGTARSDYPGTAGHSYGFTAIAVDLAGNTSTWPALPQTTTTVQILTFLDVGPTTAFRDEIAWLAARGVTTGWVTSEGREFRPYDTVRRDAMAAFMYRLKGSPNFVPPSQSPFIDITPSTPFYKEITWLAAQGVTTGWDTPAGREFRPLDTVRRDAMAAFMYRLAGKPAYSPPSQSPFVDLTPTTPFYAEVTWLASQGITTGWDTPGGKEFRPVDTVRRDAMAAFMYRYATKFPN